MKRYFKFAAIALSVMALTVACKQKAPEVLDTLPVEEEVIDTVIEEVADTIVEEAAEAVAAPVKKAATKKVATKTQEEGTIQVSGSAMGGKTKASDVDRSTLKEGDASNGVQSQSVTGKMKPRR